MTARIADAAGNASALSPALSVTVDTTAPVAPTLPMLAAGSDTGASAADNVTSDTTPTFQGKGEAGARVTILSDGQPVGTAIVGATGEWTVTFAALAHGVHAITAQLTDRAGNTGAATAPRSITIDAVAPGVSTTPDLTSASDTGASSTDDVTTVTTPTFVGRAEAGATVTLYANDVAVGSATATALGEWSIKTSVLASGDYIVTATVTDAAGNAAAPSAGLTVVIAGPSVAASTTRSYGASDDTYLVQASQPAIDEPSDGGTDTVLASIGYRLPVGAEIEFLTAASGSGLYLGGNEYANTITGGAGNDTIDGGGGADVLFGGAGAGFVRLHEASRHTGLGRRVRHDRGFLGRDLIGLSTIDANDLIAGDQAFAFIGAAAFSGSGGELRAETAGIMTVVSGDTNGDREADFAIRLVGAPSVSAASFQL